MHDAITFPEKEDLNALVHKQRRNAPGYVSNKEDFNNFLNFQMISVVSFQ